VLAGIGVYGNARRAEGVLVQLRGCFAAAVLPSEEECVWLVVKGGGAELRTEGLLVRMWVLTTWSIF